MNSNFNITLEIEKTKKKLWNRNALLPCRHKIGKNFDPLAGLAGNIFHYI